MTNRRVLHNVLKRTAVQRRQHQPKARLRRPPQPQRYRPNDAGWQTNIKMVIARRSAEPKVKINYRKSSNLCTELCTTRVNNNFNSTHGFTPKAVADKCTSKSNTVNQMDTMSSFNPPLCSSKFFSNSVNPMNDDDAPPHSDRMLSEAGQQWHQGREQSVLLDFETTYNEPSVVHQLTLGSDFTNVSSPTSNQKTFKVPSRIITLCIKVNPSIEIAPAVIASSFEIESAVTASLEPKSAKYMEICQAADNFLVGSCSILYTNVSNFTDTYHIKKSAHVLELKMRKKRLDPLSFSILSFSSISSEMPFDF